MKHFRTLIALLILFVSCNEIPSKEPTNTLGEIESDKTENSTDVSSEDVEASIEQLGGLFNTGEDGKGDNATLPEVEALQKLLEMSGMDDQGASEAFQELLTKDMSSSDMLTTEAILDMLEKSGVNREEMEKLISNPDSLAILAAEARKQREMDIKEKATLANKGKISKQQLKDKNTPTGVSLEEAILLVQAESGPDATMEKLKLIDSLAGTNVMEQMDLDDAQYVFNDVERKNEPKASPEEVNQIEQLRKLSGQLHSKKEGRELLAKLEKTERDITSGKLKASPRYQRAITHSKKTTKIFHSDIARKSKAAMKKFKQLNPDLYFGEEAGDTYIGSGFTKKAVYLPLGKLAFADKLIEVNHPKLLTKDSKNVLGEPDVIAGFDAEDITGIYSLGLAGDLTVQFLDNALTDVNGPDLYIFEIGAIEPTSLEISKDGKKWIKVGKIDGGVAEVDIAAFVEPGELFYYVRLKDLKEQSALPGADVDAIAAIGAAMRLNLDSKVLFGTGKSELKPEGIEALKELAKSISVLKRGNVIIEGHTDDVGSDETNRKLSLARAKSVSAQLKILIPSSNFRWKEIGLGESKPLVKNNSDVNRAKNRRVEVLVLPN
ncbi:Outer membrane protein class [Flagellimonas maritima]|uniref:Outer membrane protein class n=1 Tax=Flagellimonas maritima TaxID=1383885 RepID=A0A2Z4LX16_9FLAO|nr:OmpA family protein [Allomuricauda aurantiaca]AWX45827.1 Outer membrane protein class [Allomuricauda aurantiaca]